jgi:hypothetical protein
MGEFGSPLEFAPRHQSMRRTLFSFQVKTLQNILVA